MSSFAEDPFRAAALGHRAQAVKQDGGLELPQKIEGHASIVLTMDSYEHLFPTRDDGAEFDAGVCAIFAT